MVGSRGECRPRSTTRLARASRPTPDKSATNTVSRASRVGLRARVVRIHEPVSNVKRGIERRRPKQAPPFGHPVETIVDSSKAISAVPAVR